MGHGRPQRTLLATKREDKKNSWNFLFQNNPYWSLRQETPLALQPTHHLKLDCSFTKKGLKLTEEKRGGYNAESLLISSFLEYQVKLSTKLREKWRQNTLACNWENNRASASRQIPCILWSQKFHYRIPKRLPPVPILSQINPVHAQHPTSWRSILILFSHLHVDLPSSLLASGIATKILYAPLLSPISTTCPTHLTFLDMITQITLGEGGVQTIRLLIRSSYPLPGYLVCWTVWRRFVAFVQKPIVLTLLNAFI